MNIKRLRTSVAAAMGGAVLVAGLLVGASFALAQETTEPEATTETEAPRGSHGLRGDARHWGGHLEDIAEEFGTTLDELRGQLADGATLDEIATDLGIDLEGIVEGLRQETLDAIDQQVTDGNLTQERGDAIKERIESFDLEDGALFGARGFGGEDHPFGDRRGPSGHPSDGFRFFGDLDIDMEALRDLLSSGMSLDEALAELNVDVDSVIADAQEAALAHLDELVADGTIAQEHADKVREMIENFDLTEGFPFGMRGFDRGRPGYGSNGFPHHPGDGFFGEDGVTDPANAEGAVLDA